MVNYSWQRKVISVSDLQELAKKRGSELWCMTNGCFDIIHSGHVAFLQQSKFYVGSVGKLIVCLNTDRSVREIKPGRPYNSFPERSTTLSALEGVDYIVPIESSDDLCKIVKSVKPEYYTKSGKMSTDKPFQMEKEEIEKVVDRYLFVPQMFYTSTSALVDKIKTS